MTHSFITTYPDYQGNRGSFVTTFSDIQRVAPQPSNALDALVSEIQREDIRMNENKKALLEAAQELRKPTYESVIKMKNISSERIRDILESIPRLEMYNTEVLVAAIILKLGYGLRKLREFKEVQPKDVSAYDLIRYYRFIDSLSD